MRLTPLLLGVLLASPAWSGALDDCEQSKADSPAVAACLQQRHGETGRQLAIQEDKALDAMRKLDAATDGRFHAARELRRARQSYRDYRRQHCDWVEASYASGNGAARARLACEIDLDTQRLADLARHS
ncbi:lysozyme inhibitor LprI family protein [Chromobacterium vaccinii]|uniref:lysozyme inhibitor LprI family protein n=1 Tax=Chromobacterium vaccinii TaxID=1108595 RepID=UPI003260F1AD